MLEILYAKLYWEEIVSLPQTQIFYSLYLFKVQIGVNLSIFKLDYLILQFEISRSTTLGWKAFWTINQNIKKYNFVINFWNFRQIKSLSNLSTCAFRPKLVDFVNNRLGRKFVGDSSFSLGPRHYSSSPDQAHPIFRMLNNIRQF